MQDMTPREETMLIIKALPAWLLWLLCLPLIIAARILFGGSGTRFYDHILPLPDKDTTLICGYCRTPVIKAASGYSGHHKLWCPDKLGNRSLIVHAPRAVKESREGKCKT